MTVFRKTLIFALMRPLALAALVAGAALPAAVLSVGSAAAAPKAVFAPQIEGSYRVQGLNPNGTRYEGRVTITVKDGTAFFRWDIAGQSFHGQGPLNGNNLIIDWGEADPVIYHINADGTLSGTWANGKASEILRPVN